jgi:hypothetical protein
MTHPRDLLDWEITEAPAADEALAPAPESVLPGGPASGARPMPPTLHPQRIRRWGAVLGIVIALSMVGLAGFSLWDNQRIQGDIQQAVIAEAQWMRGGNLAALRGMTNPTNETWLSQQLLLTLGHQSAPAPHTLLAIEEADPTIQRITMLSPNSARVTVARQFRAPNGEIGTFTLDQFYRFTDGQWKHWPIPADYWGATLKYSGQRLDIRFPEVDEAFAVKFATFADAVLMQACADWGCPRQTKITLDFSADLAAIPPLFAIFPNPTEPWTFALVRADADLEQELRIPSPHLVGFPADAASAELLKRAIAVQALTALGVEVTGGNHRDNAYLYALIARYAERAGLEGPTIARQTTAPPSAFMAPTELWNLTYAGYWQLRPEREQALQTALALVNSLFADPALPSDAEANAFARLPSALSPDDWWAETAQMQRTLAKAHLNRLALENYQPPSFNGVTPALALACHSEILLADLESEQFTALLRLNQRGEFSPPYLYPTTAWSPDGRQLLVSALGQLVNFDLITRQTTVVDFSPNPDEQPIGPWPQGWPTDKVVAYTQRYSASSSALLFADVAQPNAIFSEQPGLLIYALSPNRQQAAVMDVTQANPSQLALMPALGGERTIIGHGHSPLWSPDGQRLAYMESPPELRPTTRLIPPMRVYDVATGQTQTLLGSEILWSLFESRAAQLTPAAWSADGTALAFTAQAGRQFWVGVLNPNTAQVIWMDDWNALSFIWTQLSADGRYLAMLMGADEQGAPRLTIYNTLTGEPILDLPDTWASAWSPTGHRLVVAGQAGVQVFAELNTPPTSLMTGSECYSVLWNPSQ